MEVKEVYLEELPLDTDDLETVAKIQQNSKVQAHITIKPEQQRKSSIKGKFVITSTANFRWLAELNLSSNELKFIAYILDLMEYGNLVFFSQAQMAEDLKMAKSNVSYYIKKLKAKGILIENNKHTYINSKIFLKGLSHKSTEEIREHFKAGAGNLVKENGEEIVLQPNL